MCLYHKGTTPRCQVKPRLTRIFHRQSVAVPQSSVLAAFRLVGLLEVLSKYDCGGPPRVVSVASLARTRFRRLATTGDERSGLERQKQELRWFWSSDLIGVDDCRSREPVWSLRCWTPRLGQEEYSSVAVFDSDLSRLQVHSSRINYLLSLLRGATDLSLVEEDWRLDPTYLYCLRSGSMSFENIGGAARIVS